MQNLFTDEQIDKEWYTSTDLVLAINHLANRVTELEAQLETLTRESAR